MCSELLCNPWAFPSGLALGVTVGVLSAACLLAWACPELMEVSRG